MGIRHMDWSSRSERQFLLVLAHHTVVVAFFRVSAATAERPTTKLRVLVPPLLRAGKPLGAPRGVATTSLSGGTKCIAR
jgi:hypothetical protein